MVAVRAGIIHTFVQIAVAGVDTHSRSPISEAFNVGESSPVHPFNPLPVDL